MLIDAESGGRLKGIKLARSCPPLTHCFFADDSILFLRADVENCGILAEILNDYCMASGQLINYEKSCLFFSANFSDDTISKISDVLGI